MSNPDSAVSLVSDEEARFVDLEERVDLLDIYHRECRASWQDVPLTITVLPLEPDLDCLGELSVSLNAMVSLGQDDLGFEQVNLVHFTHNAQRRADGLATAFTALPWRDEGCTAVLRVPDDIRVIVRDWRVDLVNGTPHRVDAWDIRLDRDGRPRVRFFPFEPESYL